MVPDSSRQPLQGQLVCSLLTAACVFSFFPETVAWLSFRFVCCQYRLIWIWSEWKQLQSQDLPPGEFQLCFQKWSCTLLTANSSLLVVIYLIAQPWLFLSYRARNTQKSAASTTCKDHLLKGKCFRVMYKFSPAFPYPGLVIATGDCKPSSPGEQRQLCLSAWHLCPFAGLGELMGFSLPFLQGCSLPEGCCCAAAVWERAVWGCFSSSHSESKMLSTPIPTVTPCQGSESSWCYCQASDLALCVYLWEGFLADLGFYCKAPDL